MTSPRHCGLEHNKRAVLAYLKYRLEHVLELRWENCTALLPAELQVIILVSCLNLCLHAPFAVKIDPSAFSLRSWVCTSPCVRTHACLAPDCRILCACPTFALHLQDRLSQQETDAAREYDELLQKYMDDVGEDICKGVQPPKSVRIQVKVKEDFGQFHRPPTPTEVFRACFFPLAS